MCLSIGLSVCLSVGHLSTLVLLLSVHKCTKCRFSKIMAECYAGQDSEEEDVSTDQEGVIDLEDYIISLNEQEWAYKNKVKCL